MSHEERPPAPVLDPARPPLTTRKPRAAARRSGGGNTTGATPTSGASPVPGAPPVPGASPAPGAGPVPGPSDGSLITAAVPEVTEELRRLRARVPKLRGALVATVDGLVLAHDGLAEEAEGLAALTAAALGVAQRLVDTTDQGALRELMVRGEQGCVATWAAGRAAVLAVVAEQDAVVGLLHLEARRTGAGIGDLVDGALDRAETT
ncbi:roadblock/LC7 domain-containing protein [Streptomyces sp. NPDC051940]|uniref:roadblock/LC7 domain-containing protein n=1 Tax=Streptomyces sp. NPDC051940 TaxID=3155675 RepID=UPI00341520A9